MEFLVGESEGRRQLRRRACMFEDNIEMGLKGT